MNRIRRLAPSADLYSAPIPQEFYHYFRPVNNGLIGQCISPNTLQIYMRGLTCLEDFRSQFSLAYVWPVSVQELYKFHRPFIFSKIFYHQILFIGH